MTRLAILIDDDVQFEEWHGPAMIGRFLGWEVLTASASGGVQGVHHCKRGTPIKDVRVVSNLPMLDAVVIAGGWAPERMRQSSALLAFVRKMHEAGKVVAAICHGPLVVCSAGLVKGRRATCYKGVKDDLIAHGAEYINDSVVVDGNLITSPYYNDTPRFMQEIVRSVQVSVANSDRR